ncbi:hypothetical protein [Anaerotruncus sp. 1XD42-93]|uniref:tyrosine-type recombinase/integrase n=1 Tax=Anaerotruncus sp. 1XD42-93 TaxID=2320853 RepID=UPI0011C45C39|nr:hypothetical protein [Anaerotruncus sp. 1XD42-93]
MPQTRQHIQGERPMHQHRRTETGVLLTQESIEQFLDACQSRGRVEGTLQWYRRGLNRLYQALPEDKFIRQGALERWREELVEMEYTPGTVNMFLSIANSYLDFVGHRECQLASQLKPKSSLQPELTREEYVQLLRTAKALDKERLYLLVKLFASTGLSVQELPNVTVEAVQKGEIVHFPHKVEQRVRIPECLRKELLGYIRRNGYTSGPIFQNKDGGPLNRTYVSIAIRRLCVEARIPEEKGNPRCLKRLYQNTRSDIENNVAMLVEQALDRVLEQEQSAIGWEA